MTDLRRIFAKDPVTETWERKHPLCYGATGFEIGLDDWAIYEVTDGPHLHVRVVGRRGLSVLIRYGDESVLAVEPAALRLHRRGHRKLRPLTPEPEPDRAA